VQLHDDPIQLDLKPEEMAQRKQRAARRLHCRDIPLYRLVGFVFILVLMSLTPDAPLESYGTITLTYSVASWGLLLGLFTRCPFNLGVFFLYMDVWFYCLAIYLTGVEASPFVFLLIARVADQIPAGPYRTFAFAHYNLLAYGLMTWLSVSHGHALDSRLALQNALIIYLTGLYLCLSAVSAERLRSRASQALKAARNLIGELETRTREREEANQARNRFLANISHELRTPMNGVLGMLDLTMQTELTGKQQVYLSDARMSAQVLLRVLNDILDLIKLQSARFPIQPITFAPRMLFEELHSLFGERARARGLTMELRMAANLPAEISADRDRICQILLNLLDNALKFTREGGLRMEVAAPGEHLEIRVSDTGMGIDPERLEQMFEPFVQADDTITRAHGGTGLGLAICRELAQLMGGELTAESSLGQGSTFVLTVPLQVEVAPPPAEAAPDAAPSGAMNVLIVEDNEVNQKVCARMLEQLGHRAVVCPNGEETLNMMKLEAFDLVLMDIQMPGIDGFEVTRRIREAGSPVRIVAVTAHAADGYREFCLGQGMDGFLTKPLRLENLRSVL